MSLRARRRRGRAAAAEPGGPLTLSVRPSANSTLSKKHMYGLCRDSEPVTRSLRAGLEHLAA